MLLRSSKLPQKIAYTGLQAQFCACYHVILLFQKAVQHGTMSVVPSLQSLRPSNWREGHFSQFYKTIQCESKAPNQAKITSIVAKEPLNTADRESRGNWLHQGFGAMHSLEPDNSSSALAACTIVTFERMGWIASCAHTLLYSVSRDLGCLLNAMGWEKSALKLKFGLLYCIVSHVKLHK